MYEETPLINRPVLRPNVLTIDLLNLT